MRFSFPLGFAIFGIFLIAPLLWVRASQQSPVGVKEAETDLLIETDSLQASIRTKGYVSGIAAGTFVDRKTGVHDLGFGLHIMDFLLAPGWEDDVYSRDHALHGNLPKHLVEGPQLCTQAHELHPEIIRGKDFVAVRLGYQFTQAAAGLKAGSRWQQTLVFQPGVRYVLSSEQITSANDVDDLFYRIDMPGHIRHNKGDTFSQVYLSYLEHPIPAADFVKNFAPDARYLYQRNPEKIPTRMIRAYQIKGNSEASPWLAGMTLDPAEVCEAWCHQRGYVCLIEELHRKKVKQGEKFGAAYVIGFFDGIPAMEKIYDRYKGAHAILIENGKFRLE